MKNLSLVALTLMAGFAQAASDGMLSREVTVAQMDVAAAVDPVIAIHNVTDANFGTFDPLDPEATSVERTQMTRSFCVYTNAPYYSLEITSASPDAGPLAPTGIFYMTGESGFESIFYNIDVFSNSYAGPGVGFQKVLLAPFIAPGEVVNDIPYDPSGYLDNMCGAMGGPQNNIELRISLSDESPMEYITPDSYRDTLVITARASLGLMGGGENGE